MNANDITFGVELETTMAIETVTRERMSIGAYHNGVQVTFLPAGWKAERDSSIQAPAGRIGCEFISPVFKGEEGIKQVIEVLRILKEKNHQVNASTGLHAHVGFNPEWCSEKLARLICIASYLEKGIYATTGTKKRERGSYCRSIRRYGNQPKANKNMKPNRYHYLNIANIARHSKNTR